MDVDLRAAVSASPLSAFRLRGGIRRICAEICTYLFKQPIPSVDCLSGRAVILSIPRLKNLVWLLPYCRKPAGRQAQNSQLADSNKIRLR